VVAVTGSISVRPQQQQRAGSGQDVELNVVSVRVLNPAASLPFKFGDKAPSEVSS
jgi:aspartyl-tRNA synthetase